MEFEWDEQKNRDNALKHGMSFEHVCELFTQTHIANRDQRFEYGEERFIAIGKVKGRVMVVAYTHRNNAVRIISARKANLREQASFSKLTT